MAAILFLGKALANNSRGKLFDIQYFNTTKNCRAAFSSAFQRAEGANAGAELDEARDGTSGMSSKAKDKMKGGMHEVKEQVKDMTGEDGESGVTGFVADTAKRGAVKATEMAEDVGETAKETMDGAWKTTKETTESIKDAVTGPAETNENVMDMQDYRNNIEDLRNRADGYDKGA